jgi:rhomboid protease GluP
MSQRAMLCPRCRRLVGSDESSCSWCGAARPSAWSPASWTMDGDWLVKAIISVNVLFFLLTLLFGVRRGFGGNPLGLLAPGQTGLLLLGATGTLPIDQFGRFWTLLSANYLHGGIIHLIFNLMALRQIAPWVSNEYGASRMFSIYTLGGVGGFLVSYLAGVPFTIGASAALCSLIGALLYYGKSRGGGYGAAVYREVSGWVISLAIFGLLMPGINNWAHGGGVVSGILLGMLLGYEERGPERSWHRALSIACAAATVGVLGWAAVSAFLVRFGL